MRSLPRKPLRRKVPHHTELTCSLCGLIGVSLVYNKDTHSLCCRRCMISSPVEIRDMTPFGAIQWEEIKLCYNYQCLCCKRHEPEISLTADHIIPQSKDGLSVVGNIQPLCKSCNSRKGNKTIDYRT